MNYFTITSSHAKTELQLWQQQGKNLLALVKLQAGQQGFSLLIPGYRCNNWYRLGSQHYASRQAALAAYGKLLDTLAAGVGREMPQLKNTARPSRTKAA